jgi:hypothetical protein
MTTNWLQKYIPTYFKQPQAAEREWNPREYLTHVPKREYSEHSNLYNRFLDPNHYKSEEHPKKIDPG